jgi:ubiquinone/menaquinone biosynthesis C-methylase UbiE
MGELLCEAVDVHSGQKVLDIATGSGNTAISAARRYCDVTGIDYVPELFGQAKERAGAERLEITFEVDDAENLPYPDAAFDVVLSTVGVMFTPDQEKAAGELLRVCKPGVERPGTIPGAFALPLFAALFRVSRPGLEPAAF